MGIEYQSKPKITNIEENGETHILSQIGLPNPKFLTDHDIFHYLVDSGLVHSEYSRVVGEIKQQTVKPPKN